MKNKLTLLAFAVCLLLNQTTRAGTLLNSTFTGYASGNLGSGLTTGGSENWNNPTAQVTVTNGSGSLDGTTLGLVASAGDMVFISATTSTSARNQFVPNSTFPQTVDTNIYYSCLYRFNVGTDVSANGITILTVNRANSGFGTGHHWNLVARGNGGQINLGIGKAGGSSVNYAGNNIAVGQTFFVVIRQHIIPGAQNDVYDLWINPPKASFGVTDASIPPSDARVGDLTTDGTEDASGTGPGRFWILSGASANLDEMRIATTWAEATPFFGQCISAGIGQNPSDVTQSAELAATFKVLALGTGPTIKWQLSKDGGTNWADIAGATGASYITPNLSLADATNKYRAIVNVSCNNSFATSSVASVILSTPVPTPVGVIINDTFLDPDLTFDDRANPPLSSSNSLWYTALTQANNLTAFNQGGNLLATPAPGTSSLWLSYFTETNQPPVHLGIGSTLKVTMPFTPNSFNSFTANSGLRIGLFDYADGGIRINTDSAAAGGSSGNGVNVRGYMLNLDFGRTFSTGTPIQLLARTVISDINLMGTTADYQSLGSGPTNGPALNGTLSFVAGTMYTLELSVTRTATNSVDFGASITDGTSTWAFASTDTNYAYHRFDSFAIRPNSLETSADSFTIPDFKVEVTQASTGVAPFKISAIQLDAPASVKLTWESVSGRTYQVLSTPSLGTIVWSTNATITATGTSTSYTNGPIANTVTERYYRISAP